MKTVRLLFSDAMARAVVSGRKTVVRRPVVCPGWDPVAPEHVSEARTLTDSDPRIGTQAYFRTHDGVWHVVRPPCLPGDLLIGREPFWQLGRWNFVVSGADKRIPYRTWRDTISYGLTREAKSGQVSADGYSWIRRPSIHMPDWAARIRRRVVSVTVERLQDVTEEDAAREGFSTRHEFLCAWDDTYMNRNVGAAVNPWVWRIGFEGVNHVP